MGFTGEKEAKDLNVAMATKNETPKTARHDNRRNCGQLLE